MESRSRTWEKEGSNALGRIEQNFSFFFNLFFFLWQLAVNDLVMCDSPSRTSGRFTWKVAIAFDGQLLSSKNSAKISILVMVQVRRHKMPFC